MRLLSRFTGRGRSSRIATPRRRPTRPIAAAAGPVIQALEGRVLLSVLYVDINAPGVTQNGSSWTTAYRDLQQALSVSTTGTEIRIADGTYKPTSGTDQTISFALRDEVAIRGGYAGYGAADVDARDIALYRTILSGDIGIVGTSYDNSYHVVTASGVGASAILDGITITNGSANGFGTNAQGGGLFAVNASPSLINCTFSGNHGVSGGGMYNASSSSPTLTNCTFSGNTARDRGGGMYNSSSSPMLANCTFIGNDASWGGGMCNSSSSPTLINCTFTGNWASLGAGMYNTSLSSPTLSNCILWGNRGSAISNSSAMANIAYITYSNIQGGHEGTGNIDADPLFVRAPWTGPDGRFGTADDDPGDLRLRPGSPALDAGSNAAVPDGLSTDLAGNLRVQGGTVDMGAYEGLTAPSAPKTLYVDASAINGANSGSSWTDAFIDLQSALSAAGNGDTIHIAGGTYRPTSGTNQTLSFALRDGVAVYGGYAGLAAPDPAARNITLYPTILSGDIGTIGSNADNSLRVVTATGAGISTLLDGVTITDGNANGYGGGMYNNFSSPALINCTFTGNRADRGGGGMFNAYSSPMLINCVFTGNSAGDASAHGGGMYNDFSSPILINCTFSGNWAAGTNSNGGGMHNSSSSSPTLINCTFSGNWASSAGGGISSGPWSSPTLTNCILWDNTASSSPQLFQSGDAPIITCSNIQGGWTGVGNIDADPLFVRNPSPGPDGLWGTADDDYGDLRLRPESPCVDRGNNDATGLAGITTDLAGRPRFVDVALTPDAGLGTPPIIDMGAYEVQWRAPAWLDPAGLAAWDFATYSLDIGSTTLTIAADDANRPERLAAIRSYIAAGRSGSAGIMSSAVAGNQWVTVTLDEQGQILVRLALMGDVTLDDRLDGDDYFALDHAFLFSGGLASPAADLNLDGIIDGRDYFVLDLHFARTLAAAIQPSGGAPAAQSAQQTPAGPFSMRSIANELLREEDAVLQAV